MKNLPNTWKVWVIINAHTVRLEGDLIKILFELAVQLNRDQLHLIINIMEGDLSI